MEKTLTKITKNKGIIYYIKKDWVLYALLLPVIAYYIIFQYIPMYGVTIAFKDYIWDSVPKIF